MLKLLKEMTRTRMVTEDSRTSPGNQGRGLPVIDFRSCASGCRKCQQVCPAGAISEQGVDPKLCIYCHLCREACPTGRIAVIDVPILTGTASLEELGGSLRERIKKICKRSLHIRYVDAGACNGCDFEINALTNPVYDIQQYGVDFVASPRHADLLLITGSVTRNLEIALQKTYEACPKPTLVVAVGACACGGGIFRDAYASGGGVDKHLPVDVYVPGCPPSPALIIKGILAAVESCAERK